MASICDGLELGTESRGNPFSSKSLVVDHSHYTRTHGVLALAQLTCSLVINVMDFMFPQEIYLSVSSLMMGC